MDRSARHDRPPTRRRPLTDATFRANASTPTRTQGGLKGNTETSSPRSLPHNESLVPNGSLAVHHQHSPSLENKRISAVATDDLHNHKRNSEISNASTNASSTSRRRKTHVGPWQLGKTIGRGGCSRVRVVRHSSTGQYGAAKIISKATAEKVRALSLANLIKSAEEEQSMFPDGKVIPFGLEREIVIMKLLEHPNIVRLHDVWENRNELYLIMEYVQGGELFHYISEKGGLEEVQVVHLFRQIIAALFYCHRLNIHHRDLKPENILLDRSTFEIKLVDFGMAALQPEGRKLSTPCGSPHYAAPEVICFKSYDGGMADVWSCGVILYVMLTGTPPFNYTGDEHDLKNLFRAIAHANYIMPDELSPEAKDLIKRILVPDPKRRIRIDEIWKHPFLAKYNDRLNFQGDNSSVETWIGPQPRIGRWEPLNKHTVDREILRNMRTLWHSEKEDVIISRLLNKAANQEKYFYAALLKHREEHLENYAPSPMEYSASDYHHVKISSASNSLYPRPSKHKRSQSGYSILNDEHLYSKHSFYEPPSSDASYDPFRASKEPIVPGTAAHMNVTVYRGSESGSRRLRPVTALGHRQGSSLRIHALRNTRRRSSGLSSALSKKDSPAARSPAVKRSSVSRSSLVSSNWPSSPPIIARPSSMAKRGVNFSHLRQGSSGSALTNDAGGPQYTPEQQRFLNRNPQNSADPMSIRSSRPEAGTARKKGNLIKAPPTSPNIPKLRIRKPESPSRYIQNEARKVSTELEKVMDEAFNRSSISSSIRTSITDKNHDPFGYDTPPTSFSNRGSGGSVGTSTPTDNFALKNRPLPPIPDETPNTFVQRRLKETREDIARAVAADLTDPTGQFNDVLEHLDQLMQRSVPNNDKRTSSAPPAKTQEYPNGLPVISEEGRNTDADGRYEDADELDHYRAVTDPIRPRLNGRRALTDQTSTIRVINHASPPVGIAPLNIRKRSGASTNSSDSNNANAGTPTVQWPSHDVKPFKDVHADILAARSAETAYVSVTDPAYVDDSKYPSLKKKKSSWFRRDKEKGEQDKGNRERESPRLKIPEAWQGLDDRIKTGPMDKGAKDMTAKHAKKRSDSDSEFPIRGRSGSEKFDGGAGKKGFLSLFGKKGREDKVKALELGSLPDPSEASLLLGFDLAPTTFEDAQPIRPAEMQMNWLSRFLHIKPASKVLCFQIARGKTRTELVRLLRDWQRYGVREVMFDRKANIIQARVDKSNHLKIKPVSFVIELFVVLEHGRRANICLARFTQTRGAASSFRKVVEIVEDVCRARSILVDDEEKRAAMCEVLN